MLSETCLAQGGMPGSARVVVPGAITRPPLPSSSSSSSSSAAAPNVSPKGKMPDASLLQTPPASSSSSATSSSPAANTLPSGKINRSQSSSSSSAPSNTVRGKLPNANLLTPVGPSSLSQHSSPSSQTVGPSGSIGDPTKYGPAPGETEKNWEQRVANNIYQTVYDQYLWKRQQERANQQSTTGLHRNTSPTAQAWQAQEDHNWADYYANQAKEAFLNDDGRPGGYRMMLQNPTAQQRTTINMHADGTPKFVHGKAKKAGITMGFKTIDYTRQDKANAEDLAKRARENAWTLDRVREQRADYTKRTGKEHVGDRMDRLAQEARQKRAAKQQAYLDKKAREHAQWQASRELRNLDKTLRDLDDARQAQERKAKRDAWKSKAQERRLKKEAEQAFADFWKEIEKSDEQKQREARQKEKRRVVEDMKRREEAYRKKKAAEAKARQEERQAEYDDYVEAREHRRTFWQREEQRREEERYYRSSLKDIARFGEQLNRREAQVAKDAAAAARAAARLAQRTLTKEERIARARANSATEERSDVIKTSDGSNVTVLIPSLDTMSQSSDTPKQPGQRYYEQAIAPGVQRAGLTPDRWEDLPDALKQQYADSERNIRDEQERLSRLDQFDADRAAQLKELEQWKRDNLELLDAKLDLLQGSFGERLAKGEATNDDIPSVLKPELQNWMTELIQEQADDKAFYQEARERNAYEYQARLARIQAEKATLAAEQAAREAAAAKYETWRMAHPDAPVRDYETVLLRESINHVRDAYVGGLSQGKVPLRVNGKVVVDSNGNVVYETATPGQLDDAQKRLHLVKNFDRMMDIEADTVSAHVIAKAYLDLLQRSHLTGNASEIAHLPTPDRLFDHASDVSVRRQARVDNDDAYLNALEQYVLQRAQADDVAGFADRVGKGGEYMTMGWYEAALGVNPMTPFVEAAVGYDAKTGKELSVPKRVGKYVGGGIDFAVDGAIEGGLGRLMEGTGTRGTANSAFGDLTTGALGRKTGRFNPLSIEVGSPMTTLPRNIRRMRDGHVPSHRFRSDRTIRDRNRWTQTQQFPEPDFDSLEYDGPGADLLRAFREVEGAGEMEPGAILRDPIFKSTETESLREALDRGGDFTWDLTQPDSQPVLHTPRSPEQPLQNGTKTEFFPVPTDEPTGLFPPNQDNIATQRIPSPQDHINTRIPDDFQDTQVIPSPFGDTQNFGPEQAPTDIFPSRDAATDGTQAWSPPTSSARKSDLERQYRVKQNTWRRIDTHFRNKRNPSPQDIATYRRLQQSYGRDLRSIAQQLRQMH